ncbi:hypothetical protein BST61_g1103 [Cercospora zeina]
MRFTLSDNALIHPHATVMATAAQVVATRTQENAALMDAPNPTPANSSTELRGGEREELPPTFVTTARRGQIARGLNLRTHARGK